MRAYLDAGKKVRDAERPGGDPGPFSFSSSSIAKRRDAIGRCKWLGMNHLLGLELDGRGRSGARLEIGSATDQLSFFAAGIVFHADRGVPEHGRALGEVVTGPWRETGMDRDRRSLRREGIVRKCRGRRSMAEV